MQLFDSISSTGFTLSCPLPFPSLEGQAPKQLTNQQQCKPYDLNIPGGGQYTQNHP